MKYPMIRATLMCVVGVIGCGGDGPSPAEPPTAVPTAIALTNTSISFAALGMTQSVSATVTDQQGKALSNAPVSWASNDTTVASVTASGLITAIGNGSAIVTATSANVSASIAVVVLQVPTSVLIAGAVNRTLAMTDTLRLAANVSDANGILIPGASIAWSSSDVTVAAVAASGLVTSLRAGTAVITARSGATISAPVTLHVVAVRVETIPEFLATPAPGALWEIPVVIVRYIPTLDGVNVDATEGGISGTLNAIRNRISVFEDRIKFMLEEGSRFRGYQDATAPYSVGYRVLHIVTVYSHFQRGHEVPWNRGHYFPDYHQILGQINAASWVNDRGVKEFWIWGYHSNLFEQPESNMSSPLTGDISNSSRFNDDLPVFNHTYTVYGYNFARTQAEAVHNHGHQLEALLGHRDRDLFWKEFVGRNASDTEFVMGRAGWTHMPPNTTRDYDYLNPTVTASDIADWRPGGGQTMPVSASTWGNTMYQWPTGRVSGESDVFQRTESQWYIFWMQSMPGRNNTIPHNSGEMTNWWRLKGDWDGAIRDDYRLSTAPSRITVRNDFVASILLQPGGTLQPGQSVVLNSTVPLTVGVYDCGEPGASGCIMDPYVLTPGKSYRVIRHPTGPVNNLTIVEQ